MSTLQHCSSQILGNYDQNCTTPHPPAVFSSQKIFSCFFANDSARPRHNWGYTANRELKRVKGISTFFSSALLQHRHHFN